MILVVVFFLLSGFLGSKLYPTPEVGEDEFPGFQYYQDPNIIWEIAIMKKSGVFYQYHNDKKQVKKICDKKKTKCYLRIKDKGKFYLYATGY